MLRRPAVAASCAALALAGVLAGSSTPASAESRSGPRSEAYVWNLGRVGIGVTEPGSNPLGYDYVLLSDAGVRGPAHGPFRSFYVGHRFYRVAVYQVDARGRWQWHGYGRYGVNRLPSSGSYVLVVERARA